MTPMIDVVFLLIIFFLVSSHLARQENHLPLDLPTAGTFQPNDPDKQALTISLDDAASIRVRGDVVSIQALGLLLAELKAQDGDDAAIRIRVDGQVQYALVEPVLRQAALAGVTDASIAVRDKATSGGNQP
ncbi:biopolymer transport protein ExbD [Rubripirellula obstinata]|uniref:Biopolymer transport protein ExbD n=2 Tax=Rubripirellula obstinata TaxID=406547 RepID=A0A5B1CKB1_9BACT|nr:biopolymer transport protein ExbD [Rubripirellula obstinata]